VLLAMVDLDVVFVVVFDVVLEVKIYT